MGVAERIGRRVVMGADLSRGILSVVRGGGDGLDGEVSDAFDDAHRGLQTVSERLQDVYGVAGVLS